MPQFSKQILRNIQFASDSLTGLPFRLANTLVPGVPLGSTLKYVKSRSMGGSSVQKEVGSFVKKYYSKKYKSWIIQYTGGSYNVKRSKFFYRQR